MGGGHSGDRGCGRRDLRALPPPEIPPGKRGGTALGIAYGTAGYGIMIFAMIFAIIFAGLPWLRRKYPTWRIWPTETWRLGHLWLGLLSFPLILFHSGFAFGGRLTTWVMWLSILMTASGVLCFALKNFVAPLLAPEVTLGTLCRQVERVRRELLEEADRFVESLRLRLPGGTAAPAPGSPLPGNAAARGAPPAPAPAASAATISGGESAGAPMLEIAEEDLMRLVNFHQEEVRPFFEQPLFEKPFLQEANRIAKFFAFLLLCSKLGGRTNAAIQQAEILFRKFRKLVPPSKQDLVADMEKKWGLEPQLARQAQLHNWVYCCKVFHVTLALFLLVLGPVHAVMALKY